jgi:ubiquinone/menaquinone biosynthesis C-methylase UbiE
MSQPDTPEAAEIAAFVASAWERHRTLLFEEARSVSEWLIEQIDPRPGQTILELAAGPVETGFLAAERVGAEGRLISTDLSARMIEAAKRGAEHRGLGNVEFRVMDAQDIELPDATVDAVLSRFGVMLTPEPLRVLREARRVLRDGGRFAYAVFGPPDRNPWLTTIVGAVIQTGHAPSDDPFGPSGPFSLADPDANRELLETAGFSDVRVREIAGQFRFDGFDHYWDVQSTVSGPVAILIDSLEHDDVEAVKAALEPMVEAFRSGDRLSLPFLAIGLSAG